MIVMINEASLRIIVFIISAASINQSIIHTVLNISYDYGYGYVMYIYILLAADDSSYFVILQ